MLHGNFDNRYVSCISVNDLEMKNGNFIVRKL